MKFHTVMMADRGDGRGLVRIDRMPGADADSVCMGLVRDRKAVRAQVMAMPSQSVLFEAFVVSPKSWAWRSSTMPTSAFVEFQDGPTA